MRNMSTAKQHNPKPLPDQKTLAELLEYDPKTGELRWKERPGNTRWQKMYAGKLAFREVKGRYFAGCIHAKKYLAHRIIWKLVHGTDPDNIDHVNRDGFDNRIDNLRSVDHATNCSNRKTRADSRSGVRHVNVMQNGRFRVSIRAKHHGCFSTLSEAIRKRDEVLSSS